MSLSSNFLICLVGLPASGKSFFAQKIRDVILKKFNNFEVSIIDPDIIREKLTPGDFNYEKEGLVRENNLKEISESLKKGEIVISDDLNYYTSMRHDLKEIVEELNSFLFIIYISTPLEICLEWNDERGKKIPNEVIKDISDKFDYFNKYQWDRPFFEIDLSKVKNIDEKIDQLIRNIIYKLNELKENTSHQENSNLYSILDNERLEKITRQIVGKFLKDPKNQAFKEKILNLRKLFVKSNLNKSLKEIEVDTKFKKYIEKKSDIKMPDDLLN